MHRTQLRWLQAATALLFTFAVPLLPNDEPINRQSLKGIKGFRVVIQDIGSDAVADGLTVNQLQTDVELRLRKAGVTVLETGVDVPFLSVRAALFKTSPGGVYANTCMVEFYQQVSVKNGTFLFAATWSVQYLGTVGNESMSQTIRERVADQVDQFLNAYLSVNPR
jgi:hypothetical protein